MNSNYLLPIALAAVFATGACEHSKSSNPLSPTVAGPIVGVSITPPKLVAPSAGMQVATTAQPVTLVLENAATNGQRPLSYLIEVAMDADFSNKLLSRDGLTPGANGQTTFRLPDALTGERTYYWRARAQDGANTGPFAPIAYFSVYTPIVLQAPQLVSPINDTPVTDRNPTLVLNNAARSGPAGAIVYEMQVSSNEPFSQIVDSLTQAEQAGATRKAVGVQLSYATRYYWRARALEMTQSVQGPWSATATFKTPAAPAPTPSPNPTPSPGGGHVTPGPLTEQQASDIVYATAREFSHLTAVFGSEDQAVNAAQELLLRTIWHLQLAGFEAGRQRNPSGAISNDKLTIRINGSWRSYDIFSLGYAGRATTVQFMEVWPADYQPSSGIAD